MPEGVHSDPIHKAVLGLNGGPTDELVVNLGCQLAKLHSAELVAIHVIEVNWQHELSDEMTDENLAASSVLDVAEGIVLRRDGDERGAVHAAAGVVGSGTGSVPTLVDRDVHAIAHAGSAPAAISRIRRAGAIVSTSATPCERSFVAVAASCTS